MENIELKNQIVPIAEQAKTLVIIDQASLDIAGGLLKSIKTFREKVGFVFDPIIEQAHKSHKAALEGKKMAEAPLLDADKLIRSKVSEYHTELERKERIRLAEIARIEAEKRREQEAEKLRLEAEKAMENRDIVAAVELEIKAEEVKQQELIVEKAPEQIAPVQRTSGIFMREVWSFEIIDSSIIPREFLIPDEKAIMAMVIAKKSNCNIPGIKVISKKTTGVR